MKNSLRSRTSWREKLEHPNAELPKIVRVPEKWERRFGTGTMVIARPLDVDAVIRTVRKGKVMTQSQIRASLARKYRASQACPLTTGIFVRIAAEAAEEDRRKGKKSITPYWRVLRDDGSLNEKFPGGPASQARHLREEGFSLEPARGKRAPRVRDFERALAKI
jgi:alkylated DNA nucleotide flippase Atl1